MHVFRRRYLPAIRENTAFRECAISCAVSVMRLKIVEGVDGGRQFDSSIFIPADNGIVCSEGSGSRGGRVFVLQLRVHTVSC